MRAAVLLALLLVAGCAAAGGPGAGRYVPAEGWSRPDQPDFYESWFGRQLRAMREPVLSRPGDLAGFTRRFRMLVLPTFHPAYAIRVDRRSDGRSEVRAVRLSGRGGYDPGRISEEESYLADGAQLAPLDRAIAAAQLASLPMEAGPPSDENGDLVICTDGTQFVFELVEPSGSRFVSRHDCQQPEELERLVAEADSLRRKVGSDLDKYR